MPQDTAAMAEAPARQASGAAAQAAPRNAAPENAAPENTARENATPEPATPVISVLVVSYNTRAMTLDCLRSLKAETRTPHEVIVFDNASTDGSADAIAAAFPHVRLIRSAENLGFAGGNNAAATHARGRYILLLNPDTLVLDGAVDKLLAFAEVLPRARIWGGRTLFADGRLNPTSCWGRMTLWNVFCRTSGLSALFPRSPFFNAETYPGWDRDSVRAVDLVTGCLLLIEREFWEALGGFDLDYFMYGEEADLCLRAHKMGADPHITPDAAIVHYGEASLPDRAEKMALLLKGKIELVKRHFPAWQRPLAIGLVRLWPLTRAVGSSMALRVSKSPDLEKTHRMWSAVWDRRAFWRDGY
jgi:GT2 family glycosyltransferase